VRKFWAVLLIVFIVAGLAFVSNVYFGVAQAADTVNGVIASDTTWTNANSPYTLTGNVLVNNGATLTIQSGVTVNLNNNYMMVNGTLVARGSSHEKIYFNNGQITFTHYSNGWNQGTHSGSIIEYSVLNADSSSYGLINIENASPLISSNHINFEISITGGSPIIFNNNITPLIYYRMYGQPPQAYGPPQYAIYGIAIGPFNGVVDSTAIISDNVITGDFEEACMIVHGGNPTIQRNTITDNVGLGIEISVSSTSNPTIIDNTISSCRNGISDDNNDASLTFVGNNLQNNSKYNVYWTATTDLNAESNWWGTTDQSAINNSIYDFNSDFNLGKVTFVPFLTTPNSQAMPNPNAPIPTLNPSLSTPSPTSIHNPS
jgi:hypothetical protein